MNCFKKNPHIWSEKILRSRLLCLGILLSSVLVISSCAPRIQVPVMRPAEINFNGKKRMAIGAFDGNAGPETSDLLTSRLFANGYFELVERQDLRSIMRERNLGMSGALDDRSAIKLGKLIGASVMVNGSSSASFDVNLSTNDWKDKKGRHTTFKKFGLARVYATFKIVDLTTGRILAVKTVSREASAETSNNDYYPPDPDEGALVREALDYTIDDFIRMIAPYQEFVTVEFASNDADIPEIESGISFCKMGRWNDGVAQFNLATKKYPMDYAAWFNLGIAYEYSYMFEEAESAFMQANRIKPNDRCFAEIANIRKLEQEQRNLESQGALSRKLK